MNILHLVFVLILFFEREHFAQKVLQSKSVLLFMLLYLHEKVQHVSVDTGSQ